MNRDLRKKNRAEARKQDVQDVISSEAGRRFLWQILSECGIYQDIPPLGPEETHRQLGRRSVGLAIQSKIIEASVDAYLIMQREATFKATQEEKEDERDDDTEHYGNDYHDNEHGSRGDISTSGERSFGSSTRLNITDFIGSAADTDPIL